MIGMRELISNKKDFLQKLYAWYNANGRHNLLWRNTSNSYYIYISEVMLQQTQVSRVEAIYYPRFLERFPTLQSIVQVEESDVLALWSGLGYYSRARNIYKCAKACDGVLPTNYHELLKLPGIGDYTASAICAFAYNQAISVLDTNIKRLLSRLLNNPNPTQRELKHFANTLLDHDNPRDFNLALMDLGSLLCTPTSPKCHECPLQEFCQAKEHIEDFTKITKQKRIAKTLHFAIYEEDGKVALTQSKEKLYNSMYLPPKAITQDEYFATFKHSYTKYNLTIKLYHEKPKEMCEFIEISKLSSIPLASLTKKAIQAWQSHLQKKPFALV